MINLYDLTVLFVDQVVTAATEGPVDSVTRIRTGINVIRLIDAGVLEEIFFVTFLGGKL